LHSHVCAHLDRQENIKPVGYHTAHLAEASDAAYTPGAVFADGMSGDIAYP
jgi:hypothetical protein